MAIIAWWNNHTFEISPSVIRGFSGLQITGSAETEDNTYETEQWTNYISARPTEIALTAHLNAYFGCDVREEAMAFVDEARWGKIDYFYVYQNNNYTKLIPQRVMLTEATVSKVEMAPTGKWISADVQLTLKSRLSSSSSASGGGSSGGGSGGYSKASVKTTSATTAGTTSYPENAASTAKTQLQETEETETKQTVKNANSAIARIKSSVQQETAANSAASGGSGKRVAMTK